MSEIYGGEYADSYDTLYGDKNYTAECDLIEHVFRAYGDGDISSVLDLGCGTGNHAIPVSRRGYDVVGVERSESMLAHARNKAVAGGTDTLTFHQGDIRGVELGRVFDAALMMFGVLGYQLENADVLRALATARRHLRVGGLFIFDIWYGPAVIHEAAFQRSQDQRLKVITIPEGQILRLRSRDIDLRRHVCRVAFQIWRIAQARVSAEIRETHLIRYFFPMELELFLQSTGFRLVLLGGLPDFDRDPDVTTWDCLGVAQAT